MEQKGHEAVFLLPHHTGMLGNFWQFVKKGELAFTYCQIPVIYRQLENSSIQVEWSDGTLNKKDGYKLDSDISNEIFNRTGKIKMIIVNLMLH